MPIYEFQCKKCDKKFEKLIFSSDKKKPECPECGAIDVQKLMSSGSVVKLKVPAGYGSGLTAPACAPGG